MTVPDDDIPDLQQVPDTLTEPAQREIILSLHSDTSQNAGREDGVDAVPIEKIDAPNPELREKHVPELVAADFVEHSSVVDRNTVSTMQSTNP